MHSSELQKLFNEVDVHGRANLVWEYREFVVTREYYGNKVNLYTLPGLYVEIYYSPDMLKIIKIQQTTDLNKFLPFIDVKI